VKKRITVAIPVFNGEKYISQALHSIIDQTLKVDNIIVCDNHSTDRTVKIIKEFKSTYKDWNIILHVNDTNLGNIRNYNKCMELCSSDFLLILSSDDKLKKDAIEKQIMFLDKHPQVAFVAGQVDLVDESGKFLKRDNLRKDRIFKKGEILEFIAETNLWIQHSALMMRPKYTKSIGFWDYKYIGGDERFWAQVLKEYPIGLVGEIWVEQRAHKNQLGNMEHLKFKDKIMHFKTNLKVAEWESNPDRTKKAKKLLKRWIASQSIVICNSVWKNFGKRQLAVKYWLYGLKTAPKVYFNLYVLSKFKNVIRHIIKK